MSQPLTDAVVAALTPRQMALHEAVLYFAAQDQMVTPTTITDYAERFEVWLTDREALGLCGHPHPYSRQRGDGQECIRQARHTGKHRYGRR